MPKLVLKTGMCNIEEWAKFKQQIKSAFVLKPELCYSCFSQYKPSRKKGESVATFIDRMANDLDSFDDSEHMPEREKHRKKKTFNVCITSSRVAFWPSSLRYC